MSDWGILVKRKPVPRCIELKQESLGVKIKERLEMGRTRALEYLKEAKAGVKKMTE